VIINTIVFTGLFFILKKWEGTMKISDKTMDKMFAVVFIAAAAAWLAVIVISGIITHSWTSALKVAAACGLYLFGYYSYLNINSYKRDSSSKRFLYWGLMAAGLIFAGILLFRMNTGWMWIVLAILQIFPLIVDRMISKNVTKELAEQRQRHTREQKVQMVSQATNIRDFASALGMNVIDLRSAEEKNIQQRAGSALSSEDEDYARRLVGLFREMDMLFSSDKAAYDHKRAEARQIGQFLGDHGGSDRMTLVAYRVQALGGRARDCEHAWDGICGWMA
jgi:hypothetical protein